MIPMIPAGAEISSVMPLLETLGHNIRDGKGKRHDTRDIAVFTAAVPGMSEERVLAEHTIYPLFKPFLYHQYHVAKQSGHLASKRRMFFSEAVRTCPLCRKSDLEQYGYFFSRVSHQLLPVKTCEVHNCPLDVPRLCCGGRGVFGTPVNCFTCNDSNWIGLTTPQSSGELRHADFLTMILSFGGKKTLDEIQTVRESFQDFVGKTSLDLPSEILQAWDVESEAAFLELTRSQLWDVIRGLSSRKVKAREVITCTTGIASALAIMASRGVDFAWPFSRRTRPGNFISDETVFMNRRRALRLAYEAPPNDPSWEKRAPRQRIKKVDPDLFQMCLSDRTWFDANVPPVPQQRPWCSARQPPTLELARITIKDNRYSSKEDLLKRRYYLYRWLRQMHPEVLDDPKIYWQADS